MPHIHTSPGQHDMTISAYIVRYIDDEWHCLVHMHKKFGKLLQVGGHIELHETPWAALIHEIREESGYDQDQVSVLQMYPVLSHATTSVHPTPVTFNTHKVNDTHYHSDLGYACIVKDDPRHEILPPESPDLRWLTFNELKQARDSDEMFSDVVDVYGLILDTVLPSASRIPVTDFTINDPDEIPV